MLNVKLHENHVKLVTDSISQQGQTLDTECIMYRVCDNYSLWGLARTVESGERAVLLLIPRTASLFQSTASN